MRVWLLALAVLLSSPGAAESVKKEFDKAWSERADQRASDEAAARVENQKALDDLLTAAREDSPTLPAKIEAAFAASRNLGYASGRNAAMKDFRRFLEAKPSAARADIWVQERADAISRLSQQEAEKAAKMKAMTPRSPGYLSEALAFVSSASLVRGASDELRLITDNLATYFQAKSDESRRRRARLAGIFGAIGQSMQNASTPPPPPISVTTRCRTFGGVTTCTSN